MERAEASWVLKRDSAVERASFAVLEEAAAARDAAAVLCMDGMPDELAVPL